MDDKQIMSLMVKAYLKGIGHGVDMVFDSLKEIGCKRFDLKHADRYKELVHKEVANKILWEEIVKEVQ